MSDSVFGPWKRMDSPILPTRPDKFDNLLTSNPAPCVNPDGSVLLMYKARGYNPPPYIGLLHGDMTLGVAYGQTYQGPYRVLQDDPLFPPQVSLEDPFIWNSGSGYEMIAKDMTAIFAEKNMAACTPTPQTDGTGISAWESLPIPAKYCGMTVRPV